MIIIIVVIIIIILTSVFRLQSVSDRVEKLQSSDDLISKLNIWPNSVIKKDWTKCVHQDLLSGGRHN